MKRFLCMPGKIIDVLVMYCIAGMFGGVNFWRIGRLKSILQKKFGE